MRRIDEISVLLLLVRLPFWSTNWSLLPFASLSSREIRQGAATEDLAPQAQTRFKALRKCRIHARQKPMLVDH